MPTHCSVCAPDPLRLSRNLRPSLRCRWHDLRERLPHYASPEFAEWLQTYKQPIITSKRYKDWPTSIAYPLHQAVKEFGLPLATAYYSTPDYMIAYAIMTGVKQIDMYGVDLTNAGIVDMRMSTAQWVGAAQARGVHITALRGSALAAILDQGCVLERGIYGYASRPRIEELAQAKYLAAYHEEVKARAVANGWKVPQETQTQGTEK